MKSDNKKDTKPKGDTSKKSVLEEEKKKKECPWLDGKRVKFSSDHQPTSEALRAGWEKRRVKQEIMDEMTKLDNLTMKEFEALRKDIEDHPAKHTVREARLLRYMTREKFIKDYLDRNTGRAPQDIDITSGGESMNKITVEHVHHLEEPEKVAYIEGERTDDSDIHSDKDSDKSE